MFKTIKFEPEGAIGKITINRPDTLNAINSAFKHEMNNFLDNLSEEIRILLITGAGKAFSAGADISEMVNLDQKESYEFSRKGQNLLSRLETLHIPVIAAVNGYALGGGCELAMACDIRYASTKARFSQPEVNLGLIPGYAGTQRLPRLVGLGNAMEMFLTGEMIDAETALRMGLVQKIFEPENLLEETVKTAGNIISKGPKAIDKIKRVLRRSDSNRFEKGSEYESEEFSALFKDEGKEGMSAFLEKRKPNW